MRYHYTHIRVEKVQIDHTKYWQRCGAPGTLLVKNGSVNLEDGFLQSQYSLTCDQTMQSLNIYSREMKTYVHTETYS